MKDYKFNCKIHKNDTLDVCSDLGYDDLPELCLTSRISTPVSAWEGVAIRLSVEDAKRLKKAINTFLKEAEAE